MTIAAHGITEREIAPNPHRRATLAGQRNLVSLDRRPGVSAETRFWRLGVWGGLRLAADLREKGAPGGGGDREDCARAVDGVSHQDTRRGGANFDAPARTAVAVAGLAPAEVHCWLSQC